MRLQQIVGIMAFSLGLCITSYAQQAEVVPELPAMRIERIAPELDELLDDDALVQIISQGHDWIEGPVWMNDGGYLLFSEIPKNQILKWKQGEGVSIHIEPSGYTGKAKFTGSEPGTNGLIIDNLGRVITACHGDRMIRRIERDGSHTILASHYMGKRFNSPNDLVYHSSGNLYFTDPPYGLPDRFTDKGRETEWCGVYRLAPDGNVTLLSKMIDAPNGIGLSPDEKTLYVAQSSPVAANWTAFDILDDGNVSEGRILYDATDIVAQWKGVPDGMTVDAHGNIWGSGPGGVMIISPEGKLLGRIVTGQATSNCTFGEDGTTLFITADMYLLRVETKSLGREFVE